MITLLRNPNFCTPRPIVRARTMSKAKKGSKATPEAVSWDEGLINAAVQEVQALTSRILASYVVLSLTG